MQLFNEGDPHQNETGVLSIVEHWTPPDFTQLFAPLPFWGGVLHFTQAAKSYNLAETFPSQKESKDNFT